MKNWAKQNAEYSSIHQYSTVFKGPCPTFCFDETNGREYTSGTPRLSFAPNGSKPSRPRPIGSCPVQFWRNSEKLQVTLIQFNYRSLHVSLIFFNYLYVKCKMRITWKHTWFKYWILLAPKDAAKRWSNLHWNISATEVYRQAQSKVQSRLLAYRHRCLGIDCNGANLVSTGFDTIQDKANMDVFEF